ncbi:MAG: c-type cytochrome [Chitinophagaceae bacterium]|nr:MAG: c-type cytochrome [Chitinophagaceae bacterium]
MIKMSFPAIKPIHLLLAGSVAVSLVSCKQNEPTDLRIHQLDTLTSVKMAARIDSSTKPELAPGLSLEVWAVDSLVISPIAIDIDDLGRIYYTTTNRQKNSEFDIRGHRDWEIASISLQTIEDKRAFLHKTLSPENSKQNTWLADLNGDSSHDWRDMKIEKDNVYRLEDVNGDGIADKTQLVVDDFNDEVTDVAGGVLAEGDDLFVAIGPDMWRMKDKNNDGIADDKTSMSHGYGIHIGFSGHGMSGVEMGPDGRIYWQIGDIGFSGKGQDGTKWEHPNSGVVARSNPDGSDFEVFAYGNRNTHEFAFDEYGNLISEDNDGDHPGEKERLVYITNGSDQGWRSNWQYGKYRDENNNAYKVWMDEKMYLPRWDGQAAYITPCIANYVSGPAGFVYNPGTALGPEYKNSFFVAEFVGSPAASGVHAFKLNPKGATFELGETKKVLGGILATGMDFGPDGALYVADWIDGWETMNRGRIWKLDDKSNANSAARLETKKLLAENFSKKNAAELGNLLKNADMRVRMKAQFELVKRKDEGLTILKSLLQQRDNQLARVNAIWGISQFIRQDKKHGEILVPILKDADAEIRAQAAKWIGDTKYAPAGAQLVPLLKDTNSRVRFFAAEAIGRIKYEPAVNALIEMLQANDDVDAYLRHAGTLALARIGKADPLVALANNPSKALRIAAVVALRRMSNAGLAAFVNDKDEFVATEAARAINDDLSVPDALPALANILNTTSFRNEALIRRVISANLRVGTDSTLSNLVRYASANANPAAMRAEALDALSTWAKPSVLDRVDGRLRGPVTRDAAPVRAKTTAPIIELLNNKEAAVRMSAVKALTKLEIKEASAPLLAHVKTDADPAIREQALRSLVTLKDAQVEAAVKSALADKEKSVRVAGLDLLQEMNLSKEVMVTLLNDVIATKTMEEKQAAIITLGKLPAQYSAKSLEELLGKMSTGKLSPDLYLELGEAIDSSSSADLKKQYAAISGKLSPDQLTASYAGSLNGGDANRGRNIFFRNQQAQCMKCHSYDDRGGNAGPRLNGVASRLTREQLLEALISPSSKLAAGFGMVSIEKKDGKTVSGILMEDNKTSLVLKFGDKPNEVVPKDQVAKRIDSPSSMPDMKEKLSKKEIRDVVAFLSTLKTD